MSGERDLSEQVVYVIEHEHGYVKIGRSNNPRSRVRHLQTACPYDLHIAGVIDCPDAVLTESRLHEKFEDRKKNGEWYNLTNRQKQYLLELCDMDMEQAYWRYAYSDAERRTKTLRLQGLMG